MQPAKEEPLCSTWEGSGRSPTRQKKRHFGSGPAERERMVLEVFSTAMQQPHSLLKITGVLVGTAE